MSNNKTNFESFTSRALHGIKRTYLPSLPRRSAYKLTARLIIGTTHMIGYDAVGMKWNGNEVNEYCRTVLVVI